MGLWIEKFEQRVRILTIPEGHVNLQKKSMDEADLHDWPDCLVEQQVIKIFKKK